MKTENVDRISFSITRTMALVSIVVFLLSLVSIAIELGVFIDQHHTLLMTVQAIDAKVDGLRTADHDMDKRITVLEHATPVASLHPR